MREKSAYLCQKGTYKQMCGVFRFLLFRFFGCFYDSFVCSLFLMNFCLCVFNLKTMKMLRLSCIFGQTYCVWTMISKIFISLFVNFFTWWVLMVGKIYVYQRQALLFIRRINLVLEQNFCYKSAAELQRTKRWWLVIGNKPKTSM